METIANIVGPVHLATLLYNSSIDAIIAINNQLEVIAWNTAAEQFSGISKSQAIGKKVLELFPTIADDSDILNAVGLAMQGTKSFVAASDVHSHRKHTENHFIPLRTEAGEIIGIMHIIHDVAHRVKAEMELQMLHRQLESRYKDLQKTSNELASFTYISSSNVKEPIKHIYTTVEHLIKTEGRNLSDSGRASFRRIQSSLSRMNLLLDDMLSLTEINILDKPNLSVNLNEVLKDVLKTLSRKIQETNANIGAGELCTITGHRNQLELLFLHLLDNAIKFNNALPQIKITCEKSMVDPVPDQPTQVNKEYWHIKIIDNGIGFEQHQTEKIFNIFEKLHDKTRYRGSGIGLTMARKIMDAHNGFIKAESPDGGGAIFHCYFPVEAEKELIP